MSDTPSASETSGGASAPSDDLEQTNQWRTGGGLTTAIHVVFAGTAGILLFTLMGVTMVDVIGRYAFSAPIPGGNEIVQILMAAIIYGALPSVCRQEAHITVDLLDGITPAKAIPPRQFFVNLAAFLILGFICWSLWVKAADLAYTGDTFEYLKWPHAPVAYVLSALAGIGALVFLANLLRYLRGARQPHPGFI